MKKFTLALACLLVGFAAGAVVAGPFGIFGNRGGSCANGQCQTATVKTVTTYRQAPTPAVRTAPEIVEKQLPVQSILVTPAAVRYDAPQPTSPEITNTLVPMNNSLLEVSETSEPEVFVAANGPVVAVIKAPARGAIRTVKAVRAAAPGRRIARFGARLLPRNWCRR